MNSASINIFLRSDLTKGKTPVDKECFNKMLENDFKNCMMGKERNCGKYALYWLCENVNKRIDEYKRRDDCKC